MHAPGSTRRHRIVERAELGQLHVPADRHVAQEGDARVAAQRRELVDHILPRARPASSLPSLTVTRAACARICGLAPTACVADIESPQWCVTERRCAGGQWYARSSQPASYYAVQVRQAAP